MSQVFIPNSSIYIIAILPDQFWQKCLFGPEGMVMHLVGCLYYIVADLLVKVNCITLEYIMQSVHSYEFLPFTKFFNFQF